MRVMDMSATGMLPADQLDTVSLDMASARRRQCTEPFTVVVSMAVVGSTEVVANILNLGQGGTSRQQQAAGFFLIYKPKTARVRRFYASVLCGKGAEAVILGFDSTRLKGHAPSGDSHAPLSRKPDFLLELPVV
jgi:hypothetical protein